jgi:hypothetical protein
MSLNRELLIENDSSIEEQENSLNHGEAADESLVI